MRSRARPVRPPAVEVYRDAVTEREEAALVAEADRWLRRRPYERGHFDNVIAGYREMQKPLGAFSARNRAVLERLIGAVWATSGASPALLPVHLLDLEAEGYIKRHVDHVEYSGEAIVGVSLLSEAVMTLHLESGERAREGAAAAAAVSAGACDAPSAALTREGASRSPGASDEPWLPLRLPRRSLYVLRGAARYEWAHAVPQSPASWWDTREDDCGAAPPDAKGRRLTVLFRDAAPESEPLRPG